MTAAQHADTASEQATAAPLQQFRSGPTDNEAIGVPPIHPPPVDPDQLDQWPDDSPADDSDPFLQPPIDVPPDEPDQFDPLPDGFDPLPPIDPLTPLDPPRISPDPSDLQSDGPPVTPPEAPPGGLTGSAVRSRQRERGQSMITHVHHSSSHVSNEQLTDLRRTDGIAANVYPYSTTATNNG